MLGRVPEGLRGRVSSLDFFVSLALMPVSMVIAGPAGAVFGLTAVFVVAGVVPVFLMKAVWLEEFGGPEVFAATDVPDQRRYGATTCRTHYERIQ